MAANNYGYVVFKMSWSNHIIFVHSHNTEAWRWLKNCMSSPVVDPTLYHSFTIAWTNLINSIRSFALELLTKDDAMESWRHKFDSLGRRPRSPGSLGPLLVIPKDGSRYIIWDCKQHASQFYHPNDSFRKIRTQNLF